MKKKNIFLAIIFLLIDIISKLLTDKYVMLDKSYKIINNFFYITKVYNEGASWSIMWGMRLILIIISIVIFSQSNFLPFILNMLMHIYKMTKFKL